MTRPGALDIGAAAAGALLGPAVLHVGGDEYGAAWALVAAAALLHRRRGTQLTRSIVWFWLAAAIADAHVVRQTVTYLTGARL